MNNVNSNEENNNNTNCGKENNSNIPNNNSNGQQNSNFNNSNNFYGKNNGYQYQTPQYQQNNDNNSNIPPYQNPNNQYRYGKIYNDQTNNNDEYKWNLDDYQKSPDVVTPPKKKRNKGLSIFAAMIAVIMGVGVLGFAGYGIYALSVGDMINNNSQTQSATQQSSTATSMPNISIKDKPEITESSSASGILTSTEIAKKVKPSVVAIQIYSGNSIAAVGGGSGIIISEDGYIVTNAHVVEKAEGIKVILENEEAYSATVIGTDKQTDLAVIKIDANNLTYADLGNSDQLEVGEKILAIGNPLSMELAGSVTQGIVSAINRNLVTSDGYNMKFIQVDAAINPGNSGGALVNEFGQIVGINSSKIAATDYEGIGFAIPINEAMTIVKDLISYGKVTGRAVIGFQGIAVDALTSQKYGIPMGIVIKSVTPNSDLATKNILPGDILTKLDNDDIRSFADIRPILEKHKPGDVVEMVIYRMNDITSKGQYITLSVKLIEESATAALAK